MNHERNDAATATPSNFIRNIIDEDNRTGKWASRVETRFPPEPNGYLHIGHAKSICLNFGVARDYGGVCHLRFDDTNPEKESMEYADSIIDAVRWLGFDWEKDGTSHQYFASDYYDKLYQYAELLIERGKAYVDSQSADEMRTNRGSLTEPGTNSPYRDAHAARKPRFVPPHEGGRIQGRRACAAREDRHGLAEYEHARPGHLSDPFRASLPHGRRLVRLPDVRLRALHLGCDRKHHAFAVHAGIRGSSAALRLGLERIGRGRRFSRGRCRSKSNFRG